MQVLLCDRCKNTIYTDKRKVHKLTLRKQVNGARCPEMSRGTIQDLCDDCYSELEKWFNMEK